MVAKHLLLSVAALGLASAAQAQTSVTDDTGDFLGSYVGPHNADLDVTSLSVSYNASMQTFLVQSTMAGDIDASLPGFYVIGINTGTGAAPFASIGASNILFNQAIQVQKNGSATIGGVALADGSVTIGGDALSVVIPLSLLPTTGFDPMHYGFSIWPKLTGGATSISDFAPDNSTISAAGAVPEPAAWSLMLGGFALIGGTMRQRRATVRFA